MLEPREAGWCAYLTDFGLAKPNDDASEHTAPGEILGTIDYMAPEQINGTPLDGRADVYSFGCMVYRCLTGTLPYQRESRTAALMAHANAPVPVPSEAVSGLPAPLDVVVRQAMEKDPEKRARSAGALMRWAAAELDEPTARTGTVTAEAVTNDPVTGSATVPPPSSDEPRKTRSFVRRTMWHAAAYTPVWIASYILGRSL